MEEEKLKTMQRLGEDTAYTFKGLHKEADWLKHKYQFFLSVPIVFSILSLGFNQELPHLYLKMLAVLALISAALAFFGQKRFQSVDSYRRLADQTKTIYDRAEEAYSLRQLDTYSQLQDEWHTLMMQTHEYPIGIVGRFLSKRRIKTEMNLSWLGGEYSEQ